MQMSNDGRNGSNLSRAYVAANDLRAGCLELGGFVTGMRVGRRAGDTRNGLDEMVPRSRPTLAS